LSGLLITLLVPPGATIILGADDIVERRGGRKNTAKGCYRDAVRSSKSHVIHCYDLKWVSMMLLVQVPVTAWYCKGEPTFVDCLTLVRRHLCRARYFVNSTDKLGSRNFHGRPSISCATASS
jgi:hypothetical protein